MRGWLVATCLALTTTLSAETKILAFSGSTRADSYNKKLVEQAAAVARAEGSTVTIIDLKDYLMPFYDGDLEKKHGLPENAKKLRALMIKSDGFIIGSPEYNGSVSAILKNTLDWVSRNEKGGASNEAFKGKKFALMSASPGKGGGSKGLEHLEFIIKRLGGEVIDKKVSIPEAHTMMNGATALQNSNLKQQIQLEVEQLLP